MCTHRPSDDSRVDLLVWLLLPCFAAAGSALLAAIVMQARMDTALARQKESLVEARAFLAMQQKAMEARILAAAEEARRKALEEFIADIRVDERSYVRSTRTLFSNRKTLVVQERVFFRNMPLTTWARHEYAMDEGSGFEAAGSRRAFEPASPEGAGEVKLIAQPTCP